LVLKESAEEAAKKADSIQFRITVGGIIALATLIIALSTLVIPLYSLLQDSVNYVKNNNDVKNNQ
jgi:cytochrome c oxidase assembly protein Cox11